MAERQNSPDNITNLVRRIVGAIGNLPNSNESGSSIQPCCFTNVNLELNSRFSSLFTAGDVSRGGTSATQ